jgi:succinyl-CoA synthetase beta subunit
MDLFEYQGKQLLAAAGVPVLPSRVAGGVEEAERAAAELGFPLAVKAQVLSGGRGKAGGVRVVGDAAELAAAVAAILSLTIKDKPVRAVLLEQGAHVVRELYLAITLDRRAKRPLLMFSTRGGMDIEAVAAEEPAALLRLHIDPRAALGAEQVAQVVAAAKLSDRSLEPQLADVLTRLWALYRERDATLLEVNPLALVAGSVGGSPAGGEARGGAAARGRDAPRLIALDAKVTIDDNALYRQPELAARRPDEDERERRARVAGVTYLTLDGDIGVLGNGAGLVMSTLDLIGGAGGRAADFCDVGGGARAERIAAALDIITSDTRVRALLINIFGGITRGDEVARGVLAWRQRVTACLPLVVRLDGNNASEGRRILEAAALDGMRATQDALGAVELVVAAAREARAVARDAPGRGPDGG